MSKPTLCVIVPVYKAAATLDRCVASVLAQQVTGGCTVFSWTTAALTKAVVCATPGPPETPA